MFNNYIILCLYINYSYDYIFLEACLLVFYFMCSLLLYTVLQM